MAVSDLSPREILLELGLGGLDDPADINRCLQAFMELLQFRVGRRLNNLLGASVAESIGTAPEAQSAESLRLLQASLPEYSQYVDDEFERIRMEFVSRLNKRIADDSGHPDFSVS